MDPAGGHRPTGFQVIDPGNTSGPGAYYFGQNGYYNVPEHHVHRLAQELQRVTGNQYRAGEHHDEYIQRSLIDAQRRNAELNIQHQQTAASMGFKYSPPHHR